MFHFPSIVLRIHIDYFCMIQKYDTKFDDAVVKIDFQSRAPLQLPGRKLFGRFNKDFIKQRQKKLQDFLLG